MKTKLLKFNLMVILMALGCPLAVSAYDFYTDVGWFNIIDGNSVEITYFDENYNSYIGDVVIPSTVTDPRNGYTYDVTKIGSYAFYGSYRLTSVTIPPTITESSSTAFAGCSSLSRVNISDLAAWCAIDFSGNADGNPLSWAHHLYLNGTKVVNLVIPEGVKKVSQFAFYSNYDLRSVIIASSVTSIEWSAFGSCLNLSTVTLGSGLTSIDQYAFSYVPLSDIYCRGTRPATLAAANAFDNEVNMVYSTATLHVPASYMSNYQSANYWQNFTNVEPIYYDFISNNIYYRKTSENTVEVTYKNDSFNSYSGMVVIPNTVTYSGTTYKVEEIGTKAFWNSTGLTSVTIHPNMKKINDNAFHGCTGMTHAAVINLSTWCKIEFTNVGANPLYYGHYLSVNNINLTKLVVPSGITKINSYAFYNCRGLTEATIANDVKSIDYAAFRLCTNLTKVTFGINVSSIYSYSFADCPLTDIYCLRSTPPTIAGGSIGYLPFNESVYATATLHVPRSALSSYQSAPHVWGEFQKYATYDFEENGIYYNITGSNTVEVTYHDTQYNSYSGNVTVPETVTHDGTTYTVTGIGEQAFMGCQSLAFVSIPATVTYIGEQAFGNSGISSVFIPEGVTAIPNFAFQNCNNLTNVKLPESLQSIGMSSFENCRNLSELIIPQNVTSIDNMAFHLCSSLYRIICHATNPPQIENATFDQWHYENSILIVPWNSRWDYKEAPYWENFTHFGTTYDFVVDGIYYLIMGIENGINRVNVTSGGSGNTYSGDLVIPETVNWQGTTYTVVGTNAGAFTNCTDLTSITLPATTERCYNSFLDNGCTNLTAITCLAITPPADLSGFTADQYANIVVTVPKNSVAAYQADENWGQFANIQGMAYDFKRDDFFYEIIDGNQVALIRENSTSYQNLTAANIPANVTLANVTYDVTAIGDRAFYQRTNLQSVTFPSSIKSIGNYAFYKCTGLTGGLVLNEGLESIGNYAFAYCSGLVSAIFPYSVSSIGDAPFAYCTSLAQFMRRTTHYPDPVYKVQGGVVFSTRLGAIYTLAIFPGGKAQTYSVPTGTKEIGAHAFRGSIVSNVTLPTTVTKINDYAFDHCAALTGIEVNKGVTTIGSNAFSNCTSMSTVILPSTLTSLGAKAFNNDDALIGIGCKAKTPPVCQVSGSGTNAFSPFDVTHYSNARLRVPTGYKSAYQTASIWKLFSTITESSSMVDEDVIQGDVNGDGQVNPTDATVLINALLNENLSSINQDNADMDGNGVINITDAIQLINYLLTL